GSVSLDEAMIATFLDSRFKSLNFASESKINRTKSLLRKIYEEEKQNLGRMKLTNIWFLMKLDLMRPFKWWASQELHFPIRDANVD
ncbi:6543_t:CDS:2, partial [Funneliformis mosseae]